MKKPGFIERHHLWTEIQKEASENIKAVVKERDLLLIRTAWADQLTGSKENILNYFELSQVADLRETIT